MKIRIITNDFKSKGHLLFQPKSPTLLKRFIRIRELSVCLTIIVFIVHFLLANSDYTLFQRFVAGIGAVISLSVILCGLRTKKEHLPVLEWAFLQYYVFWIFPVFTMGESTPAVAFGNLQNFGAVTSSLLAVILFMAFVLIGYINFGQIGFRREKERPGVWKRKIKLVKPASHIALVMYAILTLFVNFIIWLYDLEGFPYFFILFILFSYVIAQLLFIFELRWFTNNILLRIIYPVFIFGCIASGLISSRLDYILLPIVTILLTYLSRYRDVRYSFIVLFVLILFFLNPAKLIYRKITGFRTDTFSKLTILAATRAWEEALIKAWSGEEKVVVENLLALTSRLNQLSIIATTYYLVPKVVKHEYGKTLVPIFYSYVPRLLWKNKPKMTNVTNDYLSVKLGFQTWDQTALTTIGIPIIADSYFNFGWPGIIFAGILSGIFFKVLALMFSSTNRFRYVATFYFLLNLRSTALMASIFGGFFQIILVAWLITKVIEFRSLRKAIR